MTDLKFPAVGDCMLHPDVKLDPDGICPIGRAVPYGATDGAVTPGADERAWLRYQRECEAKGLKPGPFTSFLAGFAAAIALQAKQAEEKI